MAKSRKVTIVVLSILAIIVIVGWVWPLADIEYRLWRNGKVAQKLVQSLEARFPGVGFSGAASYKDEGVYILVARRLDQADRDDVESWLRKLKSEWKIAPQIRLRFDPYEEFDKDVVID